MGVDTKGYVGSQVTAKQIYDVIIQEFDVNAVYGVVDKNSKESLYGYIHFVDGEDKRNLFIVENTSESHYNGKMFDDDKFTYLSLGNWGNSEEIIAKIVSKFGGYIDENDCDSIEPWETYIECGENFKLNEFVQKRNAIIGLFDSSISLRDKTRLAHTIVMNSEKLKEIL